MFLYLHASCQRGGEGSRLRFGDIVQHERDAAGAAKRAVFSPSFIKNRQRRDCGSLTLHAEPDPDYCVLEQLHLYEIEMAAYGAPLSGEQFLFRPLVGRRFKETAMTRSCSLQRLTLHLKKFGMYEGE